jgi:hypothetical protein
LPAGLTPQHSGAITAVGAQLTSVRLGEAVLAAKLNGHLAS